MGYGHLLSYGVTALLWPFSYIDRSNFNRFYYYSNMYSYYVGTATSLLSFMLVTMTGLMFPTLGALWRIHFVYLGAEIFLYGVQNMLGTDAMLYYAMGHDSWIENNCD